MSRRHFNLRTTKLAHWLAFIAEGDPAWSWIDGGMAGGKGRYKKPGAGPGWKAIQFLLVMALESFPHLSPPEKQRQ